MKRLKILIATAVALLICGASYGQKIHFSGALQNMHLWRGLQVADGGVRRPDERELGSLVEAGGSKHVVDRGGRAEREEHETAYAEPVVRGSDVGVSKERAESVPGSVVTATRKPSSFARRCSRGETDGLSP